MAEAPAPTDIATRVALLEAKVRLMSMVLKGFVALIATSLVAWWLK